MRAFTRFIASLGALGSTAVFAAEQPTLAKGQEVLTGSSIAQIILALGAVLAAIFLLAWLAKRINGVHAAHQQMKVVATLAVGTRERVMLVQVGEKQVLLGVTAGSISHLASYDEPVIPQDTPKEAFAVSLRQAMQREDKP